MLVKKALIIEYLQKKFKGRKKYMVSSITDFLLTMHFYTSQKHKFIYNYIKITR
jgi:hypothetical protein